MRYMYDASTPPLEPPHWYVCAGYIGGGTPHVWIKAEWDAQPTVKRLPICTGAGRPDTEEAGQEDGSDILHALRELGVPAGVTVGLDMETDVAPVYAETVVTFRDETKPPPCRYRFVIYGVAGHDRIKV